MKTITVIIAFALILAIFGVIWIGFRWKPETTTLEMRFDNNRFTIHNTSDHTIYLYFGDTAKGQWSDLPSGGKLNADTPPTGLRISSDKP